MSTSPRRREVLDKIRRDPCKKGPFANGLRDADGIIVATFFNPYTCRRLRRSLAASGINSLVRRAGGRWCVEVSYADREAAWQLAARQQSEHPDRQPRGTRGAFDFTILGFVAGTLIGVASLGLSDSSFVQAALWAGFIGCGITVGYVADRFQRSYRYLGQLQFDIADCLWLITAAGIVLSFCTFLYRLV